MDGHSEKTHPAGFDHSAVRARLVVRIDDPWEPAVDCGDGWLELLGELDAALGAIDDSYKILQCKEKLGTLRFYTDVAERQHLSAADRERALELIYEAERRSGHICEQCGSDANLLNNSGRRQVRCAGCQGA